MDLRTALRLIRDRWVSILVLTVLAAGAATALVLRETPVYSAQATLYVSSRTDATNVALAYQGSLLSQQQVASYAQLMHTERVLSDVARTLGSGATTDNLAARVSASVVPDTSLLIVRATDTSPAGARDIANAVAKTFVLVLPALEGLRDDSTPAVTVSVVNSARLPVAPDSPKPARNITVGALIGLLAGLMLAAARHALDQTVKSMEQARQATQAPTLGSVPRDPAAARNPLVIGPDAHRGRAEALRKVAASLRFLDVERRHGVLLLTSPGSREGKSTAACSLALTLTLSGRRVMLIDADLRRPTVAGYLGLPGGVGLTSVLVGAVPLPEATQSWADGLFDVLTSGPIPPNPAELLGSQPMRDLLAHLRTQYDDVVIDAPPVLPVADAAVAAAACDGIILLASYGRTRRDHLQQAAATMRATQTPILGVVLNRMPSSGRNRYYYRTRPDKSSRRGGEPVTLAPPVTVGEPVTVAKAADE